MIPVDDSILGMNTRYVKKDSNGARRAVKVRAPVQLNVVALSDATLANRLPSVYVHSPSPTEE